MNKNTSYAFKTQALGSGSYVALTCTTVVDMQIHITSHTPRLCPATSTIATSPYLLAVDRYGFNYERRTPAKYVMSYIP